ncbi:SPFH domain / Band 7 family protein [compost metagenome]
MFFELGFGALLALIAVLLLSAFRILREYERGVVFQLGRFWRVKGPGLVLLIPGIQQMVRVDLRTVVLDVPPQDVITRDNVSVKLMQAAEMLGRQPGAMQLRYMQTLGSIAGDKSSTIVFPLPIEMLKGFVDK